MSFIRGVGGLREYFQAYLGMSIGITNPAIKVDITCITHVRKTSFYFERSEVAVELGGDSPGEALWCENNLPEIKSEGFFKQQLH